MTLDPKLHALVNSVRPALQTAHTTEADRAHFLYDLIGEVYDHVKFDIYGPSTDAPERNRISTIANAALPPAHL